MLRCLFVAKFSRSLSGFAVEVVVIKSDHESYKVHVAFLFNLEIHCEFLTMFVKKA